MGFFGDEVKKATKKAAIAIAKDIAHETIDPIVDEKTYPIDKAIVNFMGDKDHVHQSKFAEKINTLQEQDDTAVYIFLKKERHSWTDEFQVFDSEQNPIYQVKGTALSVKRVIHVYDMDGDELGYVKESLVSLRSPVSPEKLANKIALLPLSPYDCDIVIGGKKVGHFSSDVSITNRNYILEPLGWKAECDYLGGNIKIFSKKGRPILSMPAQSRWRGFYALKISKPKYELMALLIVLAIHAE